MRPLHLLGLVLLVACSGESAVSQAPGVGAPDVDSAATAGDSAQVRIDVLPSELLDDLGEFRVLPRTVGPFQLADAADVGTIRLERPIALEGEVIGEFVTPYASGASLPVLVEPVAASVTVQRPDTVQSYLTSSDSTGQFATLLVPEAEYDIVVVPDDPRVPFVVESVKVGQNPPLQELYIEYGAAVWGRVRDASGAPLAEVQVYAVDGSGIQGASTYTDEDGEYLLYVQPSATYDIVAAGRLNGRDPVLTESAVSVEEYGAEVHFVYTDLAPVWRSTTVLSADLEPLDDVTVRFTSKTLDGYPENNARLTAEAVTFNGHADVRLIAGTYQIELLPPATDDPTVDHSPLLVGDLVLEGSPDLDDLVLPSFVSVAGRVLSSFGDPVPEARVSCREQAFGRREWTTYADADAAWTLLLPQVAVTCTVTPPGSRRLDLAATRTTIDPSSVSTADLVLVPGFPITGWVQLDGEGEAYSVVEIRDLAGILLGSTLTEEDGYFEIRVAP